MSQIICDKTLFMTKPWHPLSEDDEQAAILALETILQRTGDFKVIRNPYRLVKPSEEFWREFYAGARAWEGFERMIADFNSLERSPLITFYSGLNIAQRVCDALGPTKYVDNVGLGTIREAYGDGSWSGWRNVAHAPKPNEVAENVRVLRKYRLA